jgi:hypothetical protein
VYESVFPDVSPKAADISAVRILRLRSGTDSANLQRVTLAIRTETRVNNIFAFNADSAIAIRGTPLQASQAERIVEEWNQLHQLPASANPNQKAGTKPGPAR